MIFFSFFQFLLFFFSLKWKLSRQRDTRFIVWLIFIPADCELLVVHKKEFDEILKSTLAERYDNIRTAMERFEYFKNYTEAKVWARSH